MGGPDGMKIQKKSVFPQKVWKFSLGRSWPKRTPWEMKIHVFPENDTFGVRTKD